MLFYHSSCSEVEKLKAAIILMAGALVVGAAPALPLGHARSMVSPSHSLPRPAVVMLWGTWCASCRDELRRIPTLAVAARPLPFVTLAIDPPAKAAAALAAGGFSTGNAYIDDRDPGTVLKEWGGGGTILPLAVAIDREGRVCGLKRGLLGTDQLRAWSKSCLR